MKKCLAAIVTGMWLIATHSIAAAETNAPSAAQSTNQMSNMMMPSPAMDRMTESMTSMADMCRMMMQREMQQMPYRMAALITVGTLLTVALVLFIILEIQWIRFWGLRIQTERQNLRR